MMATIILRDIPKYQVQLDHLLFTVEGGFRGFQQVPAGFHIIRVFSEDEPTPLEVEMILSNPSSVIVFIAEDGALVKDTSEEGKEFEEMASQGLMNPALINVVTRHFSHMSDWQALTSAIDKPIVSLPTFEWKESSSSRFDQFWLENQKNDHTALRTLQVAFVQAAVYHKPGAEQQLRTLLQAHNHAGEKGIKSASTYFPQYAAWLLLIKPFFPLFFQKQGAAYEGLTYLIEDLRDVGKEQENNFLIKSGENLVQLLP